MFSKKEFLIITFLALLFSVASLGVEIFDFGSVCVGVSPTIECPPSPFIRQGWPLAYYFPAEGNSPDQAGFDLILFLGDTLIYFVGISAGWVLVRLVGKKF